MSSVKSNTILDPAVLKVLSSGKDVTVKVNDSETMSTDSRVIYLPAEVTKNDNLNILRGSIDHETAHVSYTDMAVSKGMSKRLFGCLNLLEDLRIDEIRRLSGRGYSLNNKALMDYLVSKTKDKGAIRDDLLAAFEMHYQVIREKNPLGSKHTDRSRKMAAAARSLVDKAVESTTTEEVAIIARELEILWYGDTDENKERDGGGISDKSESKPDDSVDKGKSSKSSSGSKDESEETGPKADYDKAGDKDETEDKETENEAKDKDKDVDDGESESESDSKPDGTEDNSSESEANVTSRPGESTSTKVPDKPITSKAAFTKLGVDENDDTLFKATEPEFVTEHETEKSYIVDTSRDMVYKARFYSSSYITSELKSLTFIAGLMQYFANSMLSENRSRFTRKLSRGRVDSRSLAGVLVDPRVFMNKTKQIDFNTAITYLIDLSGSMGGTKIRLARESAILLSKLTNRLNIPNEILGFTTRTKSIHTASWSIRRDALAHIIFKEFNESFNRVKDRLGSITTSPISEGTGGENVDGEALLWAARRIYTRKERRRIIVVLSDGDPACSTYNFRMLYDHLKDTVNLVRLSGIELYAIGILHDPSRFYGDKYSHTINKTEEFTTTFFKDFIDIINKQRITY